MISQFFFLLASLSPAVYADVKFLTPAAGSSYPGGVALSMTWTESSTPPPITDFTTYGINLCAGGNAPGTFDCTLATLVANGVYATTGNKASVVVPLTAGGEETNAYFLQIVSTSTAGVQITNYSNRFSLTGMTGAFTATVKSGITSVGTVLTGPGTSTSQLSVAAPAGAYGVPYNMQTGATRYAPMQEIPGTAVADGNPAPLWPTSSVVAASTFLPEPFAQTTFTQAQTFSVASMANTAAAAPLPSMDDMQKFLNRWKD